MQPGSTATQTGGVMGNTAVEGSSETRRTALGTLLIERGLLDEERLQEALEISEENGERLGEVLVRLAWVSEDALARVLAEQWQLRYCERSSISFDGRALRRMSREDAARLEALPIQVDGEGVLVVALAEPTESRLLALRTLLGDNVDFVVVAKGAIEAGLRSDLLSAATDGQAAVVEPAPEPDVPRDEAAESRSLGASIATHLESLRAMLDELERDRDSDRREIERLSAELAGRDDALRTTQQLLRDLADRLVPS
jgi:type IV pilus assembly protein PilB